MKIKTLKKPFGGIAVGFVNALLGAGGGMLAVPILKSTGMEQKDAHINSVAVIMPLSLISAVLYRRFRDVGFSDVSPYLVFGLLGALVGSALIKHIPNNILKKIFALFTVWAGLRLLLR